MIVTAFQPDPGSASTWQSSPNWATADSWELVPSSGKRLCLMKTILVADSGFKTAANGYETHFRGVKTGYTGTGGESYWFDRMYSNYWDYVKACDEYYEYPDGSMRFIWHYASTVVLKSSESGLIRLDRPGGMSGVTNCFLTCKCLSESE